MLKDLSHDQVIAKIQRFADTISQRKLEKESLAITIEKSELQSDLRIEILIYEEILDEYYIFFEEILSR